MTLRGSVRSRGRVVALGLFGLMACSGGEPTSSNSDPVLGTSDGGPGSLGSTGGQTGGQAGGATGASGTNSGSNTPPEREIESSFIWIANTDEGTVSKIDTRSLTELGRYRTSPMGQGKPSRTSVATDGSVAVANRGGVAGQPSLETGVTKIYASKDQCVDKNKNGSIDTSSGKSDVRPWGEDECVAWHRPLTYWSNRPVAWAPAAGPDLPAVLWTAGASTCSSNSCNFEVLKIDGETGDVLATVKVGPLMGPDFVSAGGGLGGGGGIPGFPTIPGFPVGGGGFGGGGILDNYGPYGGASDAGGNFWVFNAMTTHLVRIDAVSLQVRSWSVPNGNGYGITIDPKGRVFLCGVRGVSRFDPSTQKWAESSASGVTLGYNGCMTDGDKLIWVGGGVDQGQAGLHAFDAETLALVVSHGVGPVKGVSVDIDGFVWGVSAGGAGGGGAGGGFGGLTGDRNKAFRLDPKTGEVKSYDGLNNPYSYSDMTGFGLKAAGVLTVL